MLPDPAPGVTIIDRYRLLERLGSGGFSTVWRARDTDEDREVAIKISRGTSHDWEQTRRHFQREFDALQAVQRAGGHPAVVSAHDGRISENDAFLVTDLLDGPMLETAVDRGTVTPGIDTVRGMGTEICDALAFLHDNDVLHLDVNPTNVRLTERGDPVIIDFNTAATAEGDTTLFYENPFKPIEQTPDEGSDIETGKPADVYACGHLLAYLLTGEKHGDESRTSETVDLDPDAAACPERLANALRRATARYPESRFRSCRAFERALRAIHRGETQTARLEHTDTGQAFEVRSGDILGRDTDAADLVLPDGEQYVSPEQARFEAWGTGWSLRDLSTNGTYVDRGDGWEPALSDRGFRKQQNAGVDRGADGRQPPRRQRLTDGTLVRPVAPEFELTLRFHED
jgi:serine/threonine protein kinase